MRHLPLCLLAILLSINATSQVNLVGRVDTIMAPDGYPLISYEILRKGKQKGPSKPRGIFFYIQGSDYSTVTGSIHYVASAIIMGGRAMVLEKRGCYADHTDTAAAYRYASKTIRVQDHIAMMKHYLSSVDPSVPVVVIGGSEGGDVASAVAAGYDRVNYLLLIGSGGGWSQHTEFLNLTRQHPGVLGYTQAEDMRRDMHHLLHASNDDSLWLGHPVRRWKTYLTDSNFIYLRQLNIPILLLQGDADVNVPVESARTLKEEMDQLGKSNLTYVEYHDMDHRMQNVHTGVSMYPLLELDILSWFYRFGLVKKFERDFFVKRVHKAHPEWFTR